MPKLNKVLNDFATGLHEYANGRGRYDDYSKQEEEALATLSRLIREAMPEEEKYVYRKNNKLWVHGRNSRLREIKQSLTELGLIMEDSDD